MMTAGVWNCISGSIINRASLVHFFSEDTAFRIAQKRLLASWIQVSIKQEGFMPGHLSFVFCSDDYLLEINRQFLQHDYYTDIITFPHVDQKGISGDLFISIERILDNCNSLNVRFIDEVHRVMIHGVLHLCGHADNTASKKRSMRRKEDYYLNLRDHKLVKDHKPS
jgi:probable rRNA maturation factor